MKSKLKRKIETNYRENIIKRKKENTMENQRSDLDQQSEAETHNTKISDSGYSTGCSNSQSQRSGSSKSIHSNSGSSNSSGYGGLPATTEEFPQPHSSKSSKTKDHKKKKNKVQDGINGNECKNNEEAKELKTNESADIVGRNPVITTPVSMSNNNSNNTSANTISMSGSGVSAICKNTNLNNSNNNSGNINSCEALHMSSVAQTLKNVKKLRDEGIKNSMESIEIDEGLETPENVFNTLKIEPLSQTNEQFCLVVSMQDGKVLYTTPTLTNVLGFPGDMWIGRSFIDFVHHKDRVAFANHITVGVAGPMISDSIPSAGKPCKTSSNTFFCCLRKYRGLMTSGFGIKDKAVEYVPFRLSLSFKEVKGEISDTLLVITATAVKTAYNRPNETREAPKFVTRHLANTILSHVDAEAVSYLGYLPQDMIGRSIFEFYHPEDLPLLKEIYESVLQVQGSPYRSKPYRFRTQNGGFVVLETEWSSFINPWSKKLEFAIGQHRLLKGPPNPDVFAVPVDHLQVTDEVLKENKIIQEEIKRILNDPVSRSSESAKQQVSKRCKDLATFMESLMDKITKSDHEKLGDGFDEEGSFSERDSVMLGEISPHHDYCDSKSSSETPPSYNQLNYNENLQRFFESKPRTLPASDENSDIKIHSPLEEEGKVTPEGGENSKCRSPVNESGTCSGSGSGLSSASNCVIGTNSTETNTPKNQDCSETVTLLTEAVLSRHNEDMEKVLIKRHRDLRLKDGKVNENRLKNVIEKLQDHCHGVKRSGSQSWEGDKVSKHRHTEPNVQNPLKKNPVLNSGLNRPDLNLKANGGDSGGSHLFPQGPANVNLWPPFSVTTFNQSVTTHATYTTSNGGMPVAGMIPVYYIPTGGNPTINASTSSYSQTSLNLNGNEVTPNEHPGPPSPLLMGGNTFMHQVQFMNAFPVYPALGFGAPSLMYSPLMMAPQAPPRHQTPSKNQNENEKGSAKFQRPASQATSVKAEPGSAIGSMVLSECSKKEEKSMDSPEVEDSSCFSPDEEKPKENSGNAKDTGTGTGDESSYSSYSSFLKTDDSMRSSEEVEPGFSKKSERWDKENKEDMQSRPIRREPPWLEEINLTPELVFRYQLNNREMTNVLESDLEVLKNIDQPKLVDDQLHQLYVDLELEGLSTKLKLEEGLTTSSCSSSGEELQGTSLQKQQNRKKKKQHDYTQLVMIYEENMPLPSPSRTTVVTN